MKWIFMDLILTVHDLLTISRYLENVKKINHSGTLMIQKDKFIMKSLCTCNYFIWHFCI